MLNGKVLIFSAPSGAGKTTIVSHLVNSDPSLAFSISATTRERRKGEQDGVHYYFLSEQEFLRSIEQKKFVEYEEVYAGLLYGTLKSEVDRIWQQGKHVMMDVDVVGGLRLKEYFGEKALAIFVKPPNLETLEERLRNRKTESEQSLTRRLEKASYELTFEPKFDKIIVNEDLKQAREEAFKLVSQFIER